MAQLNSSLEGAGQAQIPMARFRPNVVIRGMPEYPIKPYIEDFWKVVTFETLPVSASYAGTKTTEVRMDVPYPPCARCKVPTNDTETGILHIDNQPTKVMQTCRSGQNLGITNPKLVKHVYFGIHLASYQSLSNSVTDAVDVNGVWIHCGAVVTGIELRTTLAKP